MKFSEALNYYLYAREIRSKPFTDGATRREAERILVKFAALIDEMVVVIPPPAPNTGIPDGKHVHGTRDWDL